MNAEECKALYRAVHEARRRLESPPTTKDGERAGNLSREQLDVIAGSKFMETALIALLGTFPSHSVPDVPGLEPAPWSVA